VGGILAQAEHYEVMPIFAAGTCKKEKAPECVELIQALLDAWRESLNRESHGPIWSIASDGDGVQRAVFHTLFMKKTLQPLDPWGPFHNSYQDWPNCRSCSATSYRN